MSEISSDVEYSTLNDNFIMRAQIANSFWLGGLGTKLVIVYNLFNDKLSNIPFLEYSIIPLTIIFLSFNLAIGWHLEEIAKIRTYMLIIFEKKFNMGWEDAFYKMKKHRKMRTSRRIVVLTYTLPFLVIYFFIVSLLLFFHVEDPSCLTYTIYLLSVFFYLCSVFYVYFSYSKRKFSEYYMFWKEYKENIKNIKITNNDVN